MFNFDKKGDWDYPQSLFWFFGGLIFLYLSLMPFGFLPLSFELSNIVLEVLIVVAGILIFVEAFGGIGYGKIIKVIVGLLFVVFGICLMLIEFGIDLPFTFGINTLLLQIILIIYSIYLFIGAWMQ